jgi:hypothetical protein
MATLVDVYNQKMQNAELRNRTTGAIAVAAWAVLEEVSPPAERVAWAKQAIMNADSIAVQWMWAVCGNVTVQTANFNPTDGDIQFIVNTLRDKIAV